MVISPEPALQVVVGRDATLFTPSSRFGVVDGNSRIIPLVSVETDPQSRFQHEKFGSLMLAFLRCFSTSACVPASTFTAM